MDPVMRMKWEQLYIKRKITRKGGKNRKTPDGEYFQDYIWSKKAIITKAQRKLQKERGKILKKRGLKREFNDPLYDWKRERDDYFVKKSSKITPKIMNEQELDKDNEINRRLKKKIVKNDYSKATRGSFGITEENQQDVKSLVQNP